MVLAFETERQTGDRRMLCVTERVRHSDDLHPGWVRATSILLKGLERLRAAESKADAPKTNDQT